MDFSARSPARTALPTLCATAILCLSVAGAAADPTTSAWDASISATSDYIARGQSQTSGGAALQLYLGWSTSLPSGRYDISPYANIWASNIDFDDNSNANVEVDYHIGVKTTFGKATLDAFAIYYAYPGSRSSLDFGYMETGLGLTYDFDKLSVEGSFYWSPDYFGGIGDSQYYALDLSAPLPHDFSVSGHLGYNAYASASAPDYTDWSISVGRTFAKPGIEVDLAYVDSDLDCGDDCGAKAVLTLTKSF